MLTFAQSAGPEPIAKVAPLIFYLVALLMAVSAWAVVLSQNIVRMAVYLLLTLAGSALLYFFMSAEFLAAVQLIVYVGGTLILIIFGVMLTSKNPFLQLRVQLWEQMVAVLLGLVIGGLMLFALVRTHPVTGAGQLGQHASGRPGDVNQVELIGKALLSQYLVPFEVAAVLLLLVMIAAAYMARRRNPRNPRNPRKPEKPPHMHAGL